MIPDEKIVRSKASWNWGIQIPLRDGVRLSANLYLPPNSEPAPVIFALTPYIAQSLHTRALRFTESGFAFVAVDSRGRGNSEGDFVPMINEGPDGRDVIDWISQQSFCDGQVAMWGGSYAGYDQWVTAAQHPGNLVTIVPVAAPFAGVDLPFRSNIPKPYHIQWMALVAGRTAQGDLFGDQRWWRGLYRDWFESGRSFRDIDQVVGMPSAHFQEWASHPCQGDWWDQYNPSAEQYANIEIPVLTITGMCDGDQPGALAHYEEHIRHASPPVRDQHFLIIGPWDHAGTRTPKREFLGIEAGPASLVDLDVLHVEWYDWIMRNGSRPAFLKSKVAYYVLGVDEWRYAPSLDAITAQHRPLYLASDSNPASVYVSGCLVDTAQNKCAPAQFVHDPLDTSLAAIECHVEPDSRGDDRMVFAAAGRHLVYHSAPVDGDVDVSGFFSLNLWISIDQPDADIRAWIYDVAPDGRGTLLAMDSLRARYRKSLREAELVTSNEPELYEFQRFAFASKRLVCGSRLRLVIGPVHSIYSQKNYSSGGIVAEETAADARTVTVRVHQDGAHPSALFVPIDKESPNRV